MQSYKASSERFLLSDEVAKIGFAKVSTGIAITVLRQRRKISSKVRICNFDIPLIRKGDSVPSKSRCCDAVKHIYSLFYRKTQVFWSPYPHQISRLLIWQKRCSMCNHLLNQLSTFSNTHPTDRNSIPSELRKVFCGLGSEVEIRPPLHDREEDTSRLFVFGLEMFKSSFCSAMGHSNMLFYGFLVRTSRRANI